MRIMKKNYLLSAVAAFLLAALGCSDDLDNGKNPNGSDEDGNNTYMIVNISTVSDGMTTKATTPSGDTSGDVTNNTGGAGWGENGNGFLGELSGKKEAYVHDVNIFLVEYTPEASGDNNLLALLNKADAASISIAGHGYKATTPYDASTGGTEINHGNGEQKILVKMKKPLTAVEKQYQVFTIVNAGEMEVSSINTLANLRDLVTNLAVCSNHDNVASADNFIMSTHKMISNNNNPSSIVRLSTANTESNPAETSVYVERLAARIDLAYATTFTDDAIIGSSPVKGKGTFTLEGYTVVNQWNGGVNMFKQTSGTVSDYTVDLTDNTTKHYLYDETWKIGGTAPAGTYDFVLSPGFWDKTIAKMNDASMDWANKYTNIFREGLNANKALPNATSAVKYTENERTYYPLVYVKENTLNTSNQVHGYSTGLIFKTKFAPNSNFKLTEYEEGGSISADGTIADPDNFAFISATHATSVSTRLVYKDLRSVAARAFNIADGTDTEGLLEGFMEGWESAVTTVSPAMKAAIEGMSVENGLENAFKTYLKGEIAKETPVVTNLTYAKFIEAITDTDTKAIFGKALTALSPDEIGILSDAYGIYVYKNGESYHKFWIRHEDNNNDNVMGAMEFCIVRNNVYQLYVSGVRDLGDPLPYTPGKDDPDTPDEDNSVSILVTVYVKDWVKRTNKDIVI